MENVFAPNASTNFTIGDLGVSTVHSLVMGIKGGRKGGQQDSLLQEMLQGEEVTMRRLLLQNKIQDLWNIIGPTQEKKYAAYLWNGFSASFQIPNEGVRYNSLAKNWKSIKGIKHIVRANITPHYRARSWCPLWLLHIPQSIQKDGRSSPSKISQL